MSCCGEVTSCKGVINDRDRPNPVFRLNEAVALNRTFRAYIASPLVSGYMLFALFQCFHSLLSDAVGEILGSYRSNYAWYTGGSLRKIDGC